MEKTRFVLLLRPVWIDFSEAEFGDTIFVGASTKKPRYFMIHLHIQVFMDNVKAPSNNAVILIHVELLTLLLTIRDTLQGL